MRNKTFFINSCSIAILIVLSTAGFADVYHVAPDGDNTTGLSWATAYTTIQPAINDAIGGDEIWIKQGTYALAATIDVNKAVEILGGFNGTETQRQDRDWQSNPTIVDANNVVYHCFEITADATIDGFGSIANANAAGFGANEDIGGGIYAHDCNAVINNCVIESNYAQGNGAGMMLDGTHYVNNCTFKNNSTSNSGSGAGIYCRGSDIEQGQSVITNCIIVANTANRGGGIYYDIYTSPVVINCTIVGNTAGPTGTGSGGGVYVNYQYCYPVIMNSILWGNRGRVNSVDIYFYYDDTQPGSDWTNMKIGYNNFGETPPNYNTSPNQGNISVDPNFVNFQPPTQANPGTGSASDLHLNLISPVIDQAIASYQGADAPDEDIESRPRPLNEGYDMGAYEYPQIYLCDLNSDHHVDADDLLILAANWAKTGCSEPLGWCQGADFDHSTKVDIADLAVFSGQWHLGL